MTQLVRRALDLTGAESGGISIEEPGSGGKPGIFRWRNLGGRFTRFSGGTTPRNFSPCGVTLDRGEPILMAYPERAYPYLRDAGPIREALLVPMFAEGGRPFGTLWVVHHEGERQFDRGDARTLSELAAFAAVAHRVTEETAAAETTSRQAERQEARYRALFNAIDAGFCIVEMRWDETGKPVDYRFIETNAAFQRQTGLVGAEGQWVRNLASGHEQHWFEIYGRVASTGEPTRFENEAAALGRWYDVHAFRVDGGEPGRVAVLFNDITARREAELKLTALNARLEEQIAARTVERDRLWQLSRDPFVIADDEGRWTRVSPAWTEILGWHEEELVGRTSEWMEHPDDRGKTRAEIAHLAAGHPTLRFENRFRTKTGEYRWFAWTATPADGVLYCVARDVTDEKAQAAALQTVEEHLRQSQKLEAVGQLTGGVAHDFNNLLTIIRSSAEFLRRVDLPEDRRQRYVQAIADTSDRAAKLTAQLLAFARRQPLRPERFDVGALVRSVSELVRPLVGARIRVTCEDCDMPCFIEADASQFETALINLAVNARDAMNGEGTLSFKVHAVDHLPPLRSHSSVVGAFVAISTKDSGCGIDPDQLGRIFEPFYTTKEIGKGTGLGLSQVFGFAKQSGGNVAVRSEVGVGSEFTLFLPRVVSSARVNDVTEPIGHPGGREGGLRVLVVEDNESVGQFATDMLRDLGHQTCWVGGAAAALELLAIDDLAFDIVFSDVMMAGMDGLQLARTIGKRHPGLPVVLTSGYSSTLIGRRHNFEFLQKPYSIDALSRVLRKTVREKLGR